jgi:hypothetical protein
VTRLRLANRAGTRFLDWYQERFGRGPRCVSRGAHEQSEDVECALLRVLRTPGLLLLCPRRRSHCCFVVCCYGWLVDAQSKSGSNVKLIFDQLIAAILAVNTDPTKGGGGGSVMGAGLKPQTAIVPEKKKGPCAIL